MFLSYSFCHSEVVDHIEIDKLLIDFLVLFIIVSVEKRWTKMKI